MVDLGFIFVILIGVSLAIVGLNRLRAQRRIQTWKSTEGVLMSIEFERVYERIKYSSDEYVCPKVEYSYSVSGNQYRGHRIFLDVKSALVHIGDADSAYWKNWHKGRTLSVFFDPNKPADSLLMRTYSDKRQSHYRALVVAGSLLIFAGIGIALLQVAGR